MAPLHTWEMKVGPDAEGFFPLLPVRFWKDGGGCFQQQAGSSTGPSRNRHHGAEMAEQHNLNPSSDSGISASSTRSPAKSRPCIEIEEDQALLNDMEVGAMQTDSYPPPDCPDPIASFPTSGQPVSDTTLKDMLLSLTASLLAGSHAPWSSRAETSTITPLEGRLQLLRRWDIIPEERSPLPGPTRPNTIALDWQVVSYWRSPSKWQSES